MIFLWIIFLLRAFYNITEPIYSFEAIMSCSIVIFKTNVFFPLLFDANLTHFLVHILCQGFMSPFRKTVPHLFKAPRFSWWLPYVFCLYNICLNGEGYTRFIILNISMVRGNIKIQKFHWLFAWSRLGEVTYSLAVCLVPVGWGNIFTGCLLGPGRVK